MYGLYSDETQKKFFQLQIFQTRNIFCDCLRKKKKFHILKYVVTGIKFCIRNKDITKQTSVIHRIYYQQW